MPQLEAGLYQVASLFLIPALALIVAALAYALFALGAFLVEGLQRRRGGWRSPLARRAQATQAASDDLELMILKDLEGLRIVSRSSPMLGLVATMIPMGPALLSLGQGDATGVGQNMVVAFSGVTLALIAASIAHYVLTVRRRWLLQDFRAIERAREAG
ncbi:biopolymer transporter ExbD [Mesorhizobium plurifarium]|mgnify:CR=1 FL=1|nr:biopolymer transporter ExbD [Mesorhizobium plurifarium]